MMSVRVFSSYVFVLQMSLLISFTSAQLLTRKNFDNWPGTRICSNGDFNSSSRQTTCNGMLPNGAKDDADVSCEYIIIKMLDDEGEMGEFSRYILVCRYDGSIIGCAGASGSSGTKTWGLEWDGYACY